MCPVAASISSVYALQRASILSKYIESRGAWYGGSRQSGSKPYSRLLIDMVCRTPLLILLSLWYFSLFYSCVKEL